MTGCARQPAPPHGPRVLPARIARGLSEMDRRCRFVLSHRLCSCFVVIARPSWGVGVIVLSNWRLRAKTKARVAGAARAFGSHEVVEDQDVTATSATRPKSRVATRASVQQHNVASCIRTPRAMPESATSVKRSRLTRPALYSPGPLWPAYPPCASAPVFCPSSSSAFSSRPADARTGSRSSRLASLASRRARCASRWTPSTSSAGFPRAGSSRRCRAMRRPGAGPSRTSAAPPATRSPASRSPIRPTADRVRSSPAWAPTIRPRTSWSRSSTRTPCWSTGPAMWVPTAIRSCRRIPTSPSRSSRTWSRTSARSRPAIRTQATRCQWSACRAPRIGRRRRRRRRRASSCRPTTSSPAR